MTVPVTGITPIYGIEYLIEGEPARNTRAKMERNAKQIEATFAAGGLAPPGTPDLAAAIARIGVLEHVNDAVTTISPAANVAHVGGYRNAGVYRVGRAICLTSLLTTTAAIANAGTLFTLPTGFRPSQVQPLLVNAQTGSPLVNTSIRLDVATSGIVSTVGSLASGSYIFLDSVQFPGA